jgi:Domain of unknown function (DUF1737).
MKKIIEYDCVTFHTYDGESFADKVNKKIQEGFQPYGFPCIAGASGDSADGDQQSDFLMIQAMVKYES